MFARRVPGACPDATFMTMARVVVGSGGTFCVVEFSYFGLCKVPCREGLRSSAVYLGDFPR